MEIYSAGQTTTTTITIEVNITITVQLTVTTYQQQKSQVYIVWYNSAVDWAKLRNTNIYLVYAEAPNGTVKTLVVPEEIWANNYLASAIMTGTWSDRTPYIEDANISTLTTSGEPKRIQAVIGIKTETWKNLTADIAKNATGQTTYTVLEVKQKQKLTLIHGLMRAMPWRHIDPPSLSAVLSSIVRAAAQILKTAWKSLVNTLTAAMTTVRSILAGASVAMRARISLLKAGIMAAIGFLSKLFSDDRCS